MGLTKQFKHLFFEVKKFFFSAQMFFFQNLGVKKFQKKIFWVVGPKKFFRTIFLSSTSTRHKKSGTYDITPSLLKNWFLRHRGLFRPFVRGRALEIALKRLVTSAWWPWKYPSKKLQSMEVSLEKKISLCDQYSLR